MKRIMVICPTPRDERELARVSGPAVVEGAACETFSRPLLDGDAAALHWVGRDPLADIEDLVQRCREGGIGAVVSTADYPGIVVAGLIAERLGLPATRLEATLLCLHNYWSRVIQRDVVPEATPRFRLLDPAGSGPQGRFPLVVKPAAPFVSRSGRRVESSREIVEAREAWACAEALSSPLEALLQRYIGSGLERGQVVAEEAMDGVRAILEGYVFKGEVHSLGVVDVVGAGCEPGRFEYPSSLPEPVQERMLDIARRLMPEFGFDHGQFSLEFVCDDDSEAVWIAGLQPRMSPELAGLFTKVDGTSPYAVLLALGEGRRPEFTRGMGRASLAVAGHAELPTPMSRPAPYPSGTAWQVKSPRGCGSRMRQAQERGAPAGTVGRARSRAA